MLFMVETCPPSITTSTCALDPRMSWLNDELVFSSTTWMVFPSQKLLHIGFKLVELHIESRQRFHTGKIWVRRNDHWPGGFVCLVCLRDPKYLVRTQAQRKRVFGVSGVYSQQSLQQSGQNSKTITTSADLIQNVWFRKGNFPKLTSILDQTTNLSRTIMEIENSGSLCVFETEFRLMEGRVR